MGGRYGLSNSAGDLENNPGKSNPWHIWLFHCAGNVVSGIGAQTWFFYEKEWLVFGTEVDPAISSMVRKLTTAGENVLVQTPVYNIFFNSIVNNGRNIVENYVVI